MGRFLLPDFSKMSTLSILIRNHARNIWDAAIAAARPQDLVREAFANNLESFQTIWDADRILVVGGGKAGAAMSEGLEHILRNCLDRVDGLVSVPAYAVRPLRAIRLHAGRPAASNEPTATGVEASRAMVELVAKAGPKDVVFCLLSGGGSALLPLPVEGVSLLDKQHVTRLLHACGATINEMNAVRKHLSLIKGGRLAQKFEGRMLVSLIVSDVIGDPLDVIASGPTAPDTTTFSDALSVLAKYGIMKKVPLTILKHLETGAAGQIPETPKSLPQSIKNCIIGNNARALAAAERRATELGYAVLNLGSCIEGETRDVGVAFAGIVKGIRANNKPAAPPLCLLSGGETTVTLSDDHGQGGRNQEFVLSAINKLGFQGLNGVCVMSGGTDGEDGPTDAAGAVADRTTLTRAEGLGLFPEVFLARNDAYHFFEATGDLLKTGLSETNVMDVRVILVDKAK